MASLPGFECLRFFEGDDFLLKLEKTVNCDIGEVPNIFLEVGIVIGDQVGEDVFSGD